MSGVAPIGFLMPESAIKLAAPGTNYELKKTHLFEHT
jgi:hypothetical protein